MLNSKIILNAFSRECNKCSFLYDYFHAKKCAIWYVCRRRNVDIQTLRAPIIYCSRCISISNIIENPITHLANGYTYINHAYSEKIYIFVAFLRHLRDRYCARQYWYRLKVRLRTSEAKDKLADRLPIFIQLSIIGLLDTLSLKLDLWKFQYASISRCVYWFFVKNCSWAVWIILDVKIFYYISYVWLFDVWKILWKFILHVTLFLTQESDFRF